MVGGNSWNFQNPTCLAKEKPESTDTKTKLCYQQDIVDVKKNDYSISIHVYEHEVNALAGSHNCQLWAWSIFD